MPEVRTPFENVYRAGDPAEQHDYSMDLSQFAGEWQDEPSRETKKERGVKTEQATAYTVSVGEQPVGEYTNSMLGMENYREVRKPATGVVQTEAERPVGQTAEVPQDSANSTEGDAGSALAAAEVGVDTDTGVTAELESEDIDPYIPEEPSPYAGWSAHKRALFDELFPEGAHDAEASTDGSGRRPSNGGGRHFATGAAGGGKHFATGSGRTGGKHFMTDANGKIIKARRGESGTGRRFADESGRERGKHFAPEQEKNTNFLKEILDKVRKSKGFKAATGKVSSRITGLLLAGVMLFAAGSNLSQNSTAHAMEADDFRAAVSATQEGGAGGSGETEQSHEDLTGYEALDERIDGSFEQDDNEGCYESDDKVSPDAVASPRQIFELMGVDPTIATAEEYGRAFEYTAYSMKYPAAYIAVANEFKGFEGRSTNEAEKKIAAMNNAEKRDFQSELKGTFGRTTYSFKEASGVYRNYGITGEGTGRHSYFVETNLNGTRLLEAKTVNADGSMIITYSKADCDNPVDFVVRYDSAGDYTVEVVNTTTVTADEEGPSPDTSEDSEKPGTSEDSEEPEISEDVKSKDRDRLAELDDEYGETIGSNIGGSDVQNHNDLDKGGVTGQHSPDEYQGTEPALGQSDASKGAEDVQDEISYENEYTESRGGANMGEYSPVQDDQAASDAAKDSEIPVSDAPVSGAELDDAFSDLGI